MPDAYDSMTVKQKNLVHALAKMLDRCHKAGLNMNVMDSHVYLSTGDEHTEFGGLDPNTQALVPTKIVADGGGW